MLSNDFLSYFSGDSFLGDIIWVVDVSDKQKCIYLSSYFSSFIGYTTINLVSIHYEWKKICYKFSEYKLKMYLEIL